MIKIRESILTPFAVSMIAEVLIFWIVYVNKGQPEYVNSFTEIQPYISSIFNAISALFLILAVRKAKRKDIITHKKFIAVAIGASALFLINYLYYHAVVGDAPYLGPEAFAKPYYTLLVLHIMASIISLPLIFITVFLGITDQRKRHRTFAVITFPTWLLGSITGIMVVLFNKLISA